jgi:hypothetical protein
LHFGLCDPAFCPCIHLCSSCFALSRPMKTQYMCSKECTPCCHSSVSPA